ncbi:MAG: YebC/PmpR family DNA-binding transcriptional regulator [Chloroflexi bacterium]|nr:YebC/PmpR family DNA-binding transcriptional regulator [Chloroflexota bacterium]
MSGHSKWSTIKHQKGAADAKRGQLFTKLTREIIIAVRDGGSNPEMNSRLRLAVQKARDANMPMDNIERAIKKGSGELEGASLADIIFEGYGPSGTAIMVKALTDNRNRTVQEVRSAFSRHGGSLGESGCVAWQFDQMGMITIKADGVDTEELELYAIEAGAEDFRVESGVVQVYTRPEDLESVRTALEAKGIAIDASDLSLVPKTTIQVDEKAALQTLKLLDRLEEIDEVQQVSSNVDFPDDVLEKYQLGVS